MPLPKERITNMRGYGVIEVNNPGWMEKDGPQVGPLDALLRSINNYFDN